MRLGGVKGATAVPSFLKSRSDYRETFAGNPGGDGPTWYPDWSCRALEDFTLEFYGALAFGGIRAEGTLKGLQPGESRVFFVRGASGGAALEIASPKFLRLADRGFRRSATERSPVG